MQSVKTEIVNKFWNSLLNDRILKFPNEEFILVKAIHYVNKI